MEINLSRWEVKQVSIVIRFGNLEGNFIHIEWHLEFLCEWHDLLAEGRPAGKR